MDSLRRGRLGGLLESRLRRMTTGGPGLRWWRRGRGLRERLRSCTTPGLGDRWLRRITTGRRSLLFERSLERCLHIPSTTISVPKPVADQFPANCSVLLSQASPILQPLAPPKHA